MAAHWKSDRRRVCLCAGVLRKRASCSVYSFCHCRVERKRRRVCRVKYWLSPTLAILASLSASIALAEDFKTVNGRVYKDATISRVEADGIVLRTKTGISKVYFVELPKDVQERFHYGSATPTGKAVTQRIDKADSANHAAPFLDADRFARQVATKLDEHADRFAQQVAKK